MSSELAVRQKPKEWPAKNSPTLSAWLGRHKPQKRSATQDLRRIEGRPPADSTGDKDIYQPFAIVWDAKSTKLAENAISDRIEAGKTIRPRPFASPRLVSYFLARAAETSLPVKAPVAGEHYEQPGYASSHRNLLAYLDAGYQIKVS